MYLVNQLMSLFSTLFCSCSCVSFLFLGILLTTNIECVFFSLNCRFPRVHPSIHPPLHHNKQLVTSAPHPMQILNKTPLGPELLCRTLVDVMSQKQRTERQLKLLTESLERENLNNLAQWEAQQRQVRRDM